MKKQFLSLLAAGLMLGGTSQVKAMDLKTCLNACAAGIYLWYQLQPHNTDAYGDAIDNHCNTTLFTPYYVNEDGTLAVSLSANIWIPYGPNKTHQIRVSSFKIVDRRNVELKDVDFIPVIPPTENEPVESYVARVNEQMRSALSMYESTPCLLPPCPNNQDEVRL